MKEGEKEMKDEGWFIPLVIFTVVTFGVILWIIILFTTPLSPEADYWTKHFCDINHGELLNKTWADKCIINGVLYRAYFTINSTKHYINEPEKNITREWRLVKVGEFK